MDNITQRKGSELDAHQGLLKKFREIVQDILQPHHDDRFLYKWLTARDFDIVKAEKMIREAFKFRRRTGADTILTDYEIPEVYQKCRRFTKAIGFDNENSLVRIVMIGLIDCKGLFRSISLAECLKILIYEIEQDIKCIKDKEMETGKVDDKITIVIDYTNFSLKRVYDKTVIYYGIQMLKMYQDVYPELMKACYAVNVPYYFNWWYSFFKPILHPVTQRKVKIFLPNTYQEFLRSSIDPKLLPAFMGGDLTDPDGDPKCHTLFDWNAKIDPSYYTKRQQNVSTYDSCAKTATIQARSDLQIPVEVKIAGSIIKWKFWTREYNIGFGLFFKENDSSNMERLFPEEVIDCNLFPEENEFKCEKTGKYFLRFNNSNSWFRSKDIWYKVELQRSDQ